KCQPGSGSGSRVGDAPLLLQGLEAEVRLLGLKLRVQKPAKRPEMAWAIREIPPSHALERRLAVAKGVDPLGPVGLKRRRPRAVPARGVDTRTHALLVQSIVRCGGEFGDLDRLIEGDIAIEHAIGLEEIVLRVVQL